MKTMGANSPKLFGREISLIQAVVNAVVPVLVTMGVLHWSSDQTTYVLAGITAVLAVVAAIATRPFPVPLLTGAVTAVGTILVSFGFDLSSSTIAAVNMVLVGAFALIQRTQVSPEPKIDPAPVVPVAVSVAPKRATTPAVQQSADYVMDVVDGED